MTPGDELSTFVGGALTAGYAVAGLFFLRFWTRTRDGLFAAFAAAFWLMGLNQVAMVVARHVEGETSAAYLLRLTAFVIIIVAVLSKNRGGRRAP